ncbi:CoA transferase [Lentzea sp. NBRC 105346]|uniref:CoA transferase n=1 Tax=Lentzea sp. NBRC 105346 TaxID=3032205 RepID=UPI002555974F|nr:CoA transferase [Lentzea sp. NBRC 105346]
MTTALPIAGPVDLRLGGEADVQAACGLMHVHGRRSGRPARLGLDYATIVATELSEIGALAVRFARRRGLLLRSAYTSLAQAALLAVSQYLAAATADDPPEPVVPGGPPFRSTEGVPFEIETLDPFVWQRFWQRLDTAPSAIRRGWRPFQQRFATATCPLPAALFTRTATLPIAALEQTAAETGMSLVRVSAVALTGLPPYVLSGRSMPVARPLEVALPLSGMVVLESCRRVQGPMAGLVLSMLGARVIRIEPPGGDPLRGVPPMTGGVSARFHALNHGKETVEIDLATGRSDLLDLAGDADVFLHNWAPGKDARWNLSATDVAGARPGIVYAHASGWGDALGPNPPVGTDFVVQAYAGVPPSLMTVVDVFGGLVCAHGIVDALCHGHSRVESSLLSAAARLNALSGPPCSVPLRVPVCTDLAALADDPRFARALVRDGCVVPAAPWEFTR